MKNISKNVEQYMKNKGIRFQTDLLKRIGAELGIRDLNNFVQKEKGNFSKMINGTRTLNDAYIVPMEKILGVPLARLEEPESYKLPIDKTEGPYKKGIQYYAYMDDPKLYDKDFDLLINGGDDVRPIEMHDEFGKTFLDYIVEYNAINSLLYLYKKYEFRMQNLSNSYFLTNTKHGIFTSHGVQIARMIASQHNPDMFFKIFNPYEEFTYRGCKATQSIFSDDDFLEIVLDNPELFEQLFVEKEYTSVLGPTAKRCMGCETITYKSVSPLINNCLETALKKENKYKKQAIKILEYGFNHNHEILNRITDKTYYQIDERGGIRSYDGKTILGTVVVATPNSNYSSEIQHRIKVLPKLVDA